VQYALVCTQQMDQTCISWFQTGTKHCLHEYWRTKIMYCDNYYQILALTTMDSRRDNYKLNIKSETRCRNFITRLLSKDMY